MTTPQPTLNDLFDRLWDLPLSRKQRAAAGIFADIRRLYPKDYEDHPEFNRKLLEHSKRRSAEEKRIEDEAEAAIRTANPNPTVEQLAEQAAKLPPGWEAIFRDNPNLTAADLAMHFRRHEKFCRQAAELRASWEDDQSSSEPMTREHPRWAEFIGRLDGPEGSDGYCANGHSVNLDHPEMTHVFSRAVLFKMGLTVEAIAESIAYFKEHGGYCDCEVLMNVNREQ